MNLLNSINRSSDGSGQMLNWVTYSLGLGEPLDVSLTLAKADLQMGNYGEFLWIGEFTAVLLRTSRHR